MWKLSKKEIKKKPLVWQCTLIMYIGNCLPCLKKKVMFYTTWSLRAWFQFRWTIVWSKFQQNPCKLRVWKYPPFEYCVFQNREKSKVCYLSIWWIFQSHSSFSPFLFFSLIFFLSIFSLPLFPSPFSLSHHPSLSLSLLSSFLLSFHSSSSFFLLAAHIENIWFLEATYVLTSCATTQNSLVMKWCIYSHT